MAGEDSDFSICSSFEMKDEKDSTESVIENKKHSFYNIKEKMKEFFSWVYNFGYIKSIMCLIIFLFSAYISSNEKHKFYCKARINEGINTSLENFSSNIRNRAFLTISYMSYRSIFLSLSLISFIYIGISIVLRNVFCILSMSYINYNICLSCFVYASEHISFTICCALLFFLIELYQFNFKITYLNSLDLYITEIIILMFLINFLYFFVTLMNGFIKSTYNTTTYAERIMNIYRKDYFIRFLVKLNKNIEDIKDDEINQLYKKELSFTHKSLDENMLKKVTEAYFQSENGELEQGIKSWIHVSFGNKIQKPFYRHKGMESMYRYLIKKKLNSYVNKIQELKLYNIVKISDLEKYFESKTLFMNFLQKINIKPETSFNDTMFFTKFIKKNIKDRRCITKSITQIDNAIESLVRACYSFITVIVVCYVYSVVWDSKSIALSVLTAFFGTGLVFQPSVKTAVDSAIFLFCIHPYDVGDRVLIKIDNVIENMVVKELNIFSTVFTKLDGQVVYYPNVFLFNQPITNLRRASNYMEIFRFMIDTKTSKKKLNAIEKKIKNYLKDEKNGFQTSFTFNYEKFENTNRLVMKLLVTTLKNIQGYEEFMIKKKNLFCFVNEEMLNNGVTYDVPIQKINVTQIT